MIENGGVIRQFSCEECFYVATNISACDKIKAGHMSRHSKTLSRHKIQSQHLKARRLCCDRKVLCCDRHNKRLR